MNPKGGRKMAEMLYRVSQEPNEAGTLGSHAERALKRLIDIEIMVGKIESALFGGSAIGGELTNDSKALRSIENSIVKTASKAEGVLHRLEMIRNGLTSDRNGHDSLQPSYTIGNVDALELTPSAGTPKKPNTYQCDFCRQPAQHIHAEQGKWACDQCWPRVRQMK